jgi:hypothetical protein
MIGREELFSWFLPTQSNTGLSQCKAYSRLELGFSKTSPTIVFKPSQIREVEDTFADGSTEDTSFLQEGQRLKETLDHRKVMNDGCSLISIGAARQTAQQLGLSGPPPSVFQARIGCWKGVWMTDPRDANVSGGSEYDIWICVTPSQQKFYRHPEDHDDSTYDPRRTTFEVVRYSTTTSPARLSPTLIPILVDRTVPEGNLHRLFRASIEYEGTTLLSAAEDPQLLRQWISSKASVLRNHQVTSETAWLGSLPLSKPNLVLLLLETGLAPDEEPYLAENVRSLMKKHLTQLNKHLNPRVGRSTYVFAVADPIGCLRPGEIYLAFSERFVDQQSGFCDMMLHDVEVVVARQPALRGSDIQKVRAVFKPELRRLLNVVVFPSKGTFPLAERMQNGDYDGDRFWVCWEPTIVQEFKNTPSPPDLPDPGSLGIRVIDKTLDDTFVGANKKAIRALFDLNFDIRCRDDLLGICTDFRERMAYAANSIQTPEVRLLDDLHDLLVDASKMGYVFTEEAWRYLLRHFPSASCLFGRSFLPLLFRATVSIDS